MIYRIRLIIGFMFINILNSYSQDHMKSLFAANYSFGFAQGSLHDYIPKELFDGFHMEYRHFIKNKFSVGVNVGWNSFRKQLPRNVYQVNGTAISAVQTRFFYAFPININFHYYFNIGKLIRPYIGGSIGPYLTDYKKFYGGVPVEKKYTNFGLAPEAGIFIPVKNIGMGFMASVKYNYVMYKVEEISNVRFLELKAGVYFGYPVSY